ncbi:hypothetical protein F4823DRAFT_312835 [Ustulina deusta]|nr:hypothetical protein F4823DRAFT_312835 [Ustulina deusta]
MEQVPRPAPLRSLNPLTDYSTVFLPFSPEEEELVSRLLRDDDIIPASPLDFGSPEAPKRKLGDLAADYLNAPSVTGIDSAAAKRLKLNQKHEGSAVKKLACPFFKRDGHNTAISRPCRGPGWDSISRVKEHLYRCHALKNQCNRCGNGFDSPIDLATHQRNPESCPLLHTPLPEAITGDQIARLRSRGGKRVNGSNEEKWASLYRILFPSDSFVPSPYYDEPCGGCVSKAGSRLLDDYRQYQLRELVPLVEQELAAISHNNNMSDDLCAHIADRLSRLSVKVLDGFQEKCKMDIGEKKPVACPSQHGTALEDTTCETVPMLNDSQKLLNNDSMLDMPEFALENFVFMV